MTILETHEVETINKALGILRSKFNQTDSFTSSAISKNYVQLQLAAREREVFACIFLNNQHNLLSYEELFFGTIDGATVHPREVVKSAMRWNAAAVIFAHNHPSGMAEPSQADIALTQKMKSILEVIDVRVLDHMIVGGGDVCSFAEKGLL